MRAPLIHWSAVLLLCVSCAADEGSPKDPTSPAVEAREVVINGAALSAEQLRELETSYGVQAVPGRYWYDAASGLYGVEGMPTMGLLRPGHDFGPLASDASRGASGVFLNGRELTPSEVAWLSSYTGAIAPGRYWMDASTNIGIEGNPLPAVNLAVLAQSGRYDEMGDNGWSGRGGGGNFTPDGSSGYVHIPDAGGGSGIFVGY